MKVKVTSPLQHDGTRYEAGQTVELSEGLAEQLVRDGVVEQVQEEEPKKEAQTEKEAKPEFRAPTSPKVVVDEEPEENHPDPRRDAAEAAPVEEPKPTRKAPRRKGA
jgi:hypothetical protein